MRISALLSTVVLLVSATSTCFGAEPYPNRQINWIVPVAAGGSTDAISRILTQELAGVLGVPFVVENYPGAGGTIGLSKLAKSAPDGYTIALAQISNVALAPGFYPQLPYDPAKDFTPVTLVTHEPLVFVVNPSSGIHSLKDLVALVRSKPDSISFGSAGRGSIGQLTGIMLEHASGTRMISVPYKSGAQPMIDLLGNRISVGVVALPTALPFIKKSNTLVALAVSSKTRAPAIPDVPTVVESGYKGFESNNWYGVMMPANTPKEIVARVHAAVVEVLGRRSVREALVSQGGEVVGNTPEEFRVFINTEVSKWTKIIKQSASVAD